MTLPEPKYAASNDPPVDPDPHNGSTQNMVVRNFDNGTDALRTIFEEKVKKRDNSELAAEDKQIKDFKDGMDSVFLLVRSYFV